MLRFRTGKAGLLLRTASEHSADRIELAVAAGRVRASVRLGDREKVRYFDLKPAYVPPMHYYIAFPQMQDIKCNVRSSFHYSLFKKHWYSPCYRAIKTISRTISYQEYSAAETARVARQVCQKLCTCKRDPNSVVQGGNYRRPLQSLPFETVTSWVVMVHQVSRAYQQRAASWKCASSIWAVAATVFQPPDGLLVSADSLLFSAALGYRIGECRGQLSETATVECSSSTDLFW